MELNTLAGRSYNDITQVDMLESNADNTLYLISFLANFSEFYCSIRFFHGFCQTTPQKAWILEILCHTEISPR